MSLLWKEWHQQKWITLGGLASGIAFPILECISSWIENRYWIPDTESGSAILMLGGAIFAIILAIISMHHDIRKGADIFLLSKPIMLRQFFVIKFILASCLLFFVFLGTISIDLITNIIGRNEIAMFAWKILCYTYPIALLLYAASVFFMVITRDAAKAAFLAIWTGALVYFLPLILNSLKWINIFELMEKNQTSIFAHLLQSLRDWRTNSFGDWMLKALSQYQWEYLGDYLLFLGTMLTGAIVFIELTIKAERNHWRWHPEQKSIVWTLGGTAAAIFVIAIFQIGHNLKPAKDLNGKTVVNPVEFTLNDAIESLNEGLPENNRIVPESIHYADHMNSMCIKGDLMFHFATGCQSDIVEWYNQHNYIEHFIVLVYRFPYNNNFTPHISDNTNSGLLVSATRFFQTQPTRDYWNQYIIGCFVRGDRLYAAYQPNHIKGETNDRGYDYYPGSLNPMYFVTFDISNPEHPKMISNIEILRSDYQERHMAAIDDYCYIDAGPQLLIVSVKDSNNPKVIHSLEDQDIFVDSYREEKPELMPRRWTEDRQFLIADNHLIYSNDYRIKIMDISDRLVPCTVYDEILPGQYFNERISTVFFKTKRLYVSTEGGVYIFALEQNNEGTYTSRLIGQRKATTIERFAGRRPHALFELDNYLIEMAGSFGILVYDISDLSKPHRVYHAQEGGHTNKFGLWKGLLYAQEGGNRMFFYQLPEQSN